MWDAERKLMQGKSILQRYDEPAMGLLSDAPALKIFYENGSYHASFISNKRILS